jgi:UDP-GlcNAc:undecaprenyl-phosphate/decaprenyl-phosphate GlcNAc-1-phosphate transferase
MNILSFLATVILINSLFIFNFKKISLLINLDDEPNKVKIHKKKVPCFGGIIFVVNIILFTIYAFYLGENNYIKNDLILSKRSAFSFLIISFLFFALGFFDDKFKISSNKKLILQFFFIILALLVDEDLIITFLKFPNNFEINLFNLSLLFSILCFLIFINAFNMFDGINNQVSIYIFIICIYLFFKTDNYFLILAIIISNIIFFYLNIQGKIFLGDNGTLFVSYILSYIIVKSYNSDQLQNSLEIAVLMFVPVIDLIRLFFIRLIKNKHPFSGDKTHLHHLLLRKHGLVKTNSYISIAIILPLLALIFNIYLALILAIIIYFCLIFNAKKII